MSIAGSKQKAVMASRAIARGRKYLLQRLNAPLRCGSNISSSEHGSLAHNVETRLLDHASKLRNLDFDHGKVHRIFFLYREELCCSSPARFLGGHLSGISLLNREFGRSEVSLPFVARGLSQYVHTASTATAKQLEIGSEEHDEDQKKKENKEASPEECDQAVEGLSTAKAKAKAKQMQESQKNYQFIHKFWAKLLGIGPALRAVASMSR